jgi:hypothetical protein
MVEQREDGWYAGSSGPWKTERAAKMAAKGFWSLAHKADGQRMPYAEEMPD